MRSKVRYDASTKNWHFKINNAPVRREQYPHLEHDATPVTSISLNQSQDCFTVVSGQVFEVKQNESDKENLGTFVQELEEPVVSVTMLYRTNIMLVVQEDDPKMLHVWDDVQKKYITEMGYKTEIKAVKLRSEILVIVLATKTYIFDFPNLSPIKVLETAQNDEGLVGIANDRRPTHIVIAVPSNYVGSVTIFTYASDLVDETLIRAFDSKLSAIGVNSMGTLVAVASSESSEIKVLSSQGGQTLQTLRCGSIDTVSGKIVFDPSRPLLACMSARSIYVMPVQEAEKQGSQLPLEGFS